MAGEVATALLVLALLATTMAVAYGPEAPALLLFRAPLQGPNGPPEPLYQWGRTYEPCSGGNSLWYGVRCNEKGQVRVLQLERLGLQGPAPNLLTMLAPLAGLRSLSLANNNLTGAFPDVSALPNLRMLYLHGNRLAGRIPDDALATMRGLQKLYLSGNAFTGATPSSVTLSPRLLELQLSNNGFQGALPDFSGQMGLKLVDFSNNHLSGPIPAGLRRFDASAFRGNSGLCGSPLNVSCPTASAPFPPPAPPQSP